MKFQNPSMHFSEVMLCIKKACSVKMPKVTKGHISLSIFQNSFKSYSGHLLINTKLFTRFQASSFHRFLDIYADKISFIFFQRAITQERSIILMGKIRVSFCFMRNPYMKFQNPSMHCSKVILCIKKHAM